MILVQEVLRAGNRVPGKKGKEGTHNKDSENLKP